MLNGLCYGISLQYTHREVETARKARELLSRMGYPSVENAIEMIKGGDNFGVSENDLLWIASDCRCDMGKRHY